MSRNCIRVIQGILCVSELISSDAKKKIRSSISPCRACSTIHSSVAGVLLWRSLIVKFSTLRRDRKELPYRCTCAGGRTNLVRPPPRPSPPFLPTYRAARFQSSLGSVLSTARGFKLKFETLEKPTANFVHLLATVSSAPLSLSLPFFSASYNIRDVFYD